MKKRLLKPISIFLTVAFLFQFLFPTVSLALTGGPSQPEVQSFSPIGTSDMVNLFSGDFSYNIPLIDVGGYPVNLAYNSNIGMDQEASWVGLGWNINPGVINRNMRGLPDDFNGGDDKVTKEFNMKPNVTYGVDAGVQLKLFGIKMPKKFGLNLGIFHNNYKGWGMNFGVSASMNAGKGGKGPMTANLGLGFNSQTGVTTSASVGYKKTDSEQNDITTSIGSSYNNRGGLQNLSIRTTASKEYEKSLEGGKTIKGSQSIEIASSSLSLGPTSYTPTITMPLHNFSYSFAGTFGGAIWGAHPDLVVTGFLSKQSLVKKTQSLSAFGYIHSENGAQDLSNLLDYNRQNDEPYTSQITSLPIPIFTHDLFSATAQGMSGEFRAYRGDVGILFDHKTDIASASADGGIEIGAPLLFHGGGNIDATAVFTKTQKWKDDNNLIPNADFLRNYLPYQGFENCYFKNIGEQTVNDENYYASIGNEEPIKFSLNGNGAIAERKFKRYSISGNSNLGDIGTPYVLSKSTREKRTQLISCLSGYEASYAGLDKDILSYKRNTYVFVKGCTYGRGGTNPYVDRILRHNHSNHISEITVTKSDGKRFVYGIPAYNNLQRDVTFACKDIGDTSSTGLINYNPGVDNNKDQNKNGNDNYFNAEQLSPFAYSYLLTGILSSDYVDRTGNGISDDDEGEANCFNYTRTSSAYNWRVPYQRNTANYNAGLHSGNGKAGSIGDAKASYLYGSKEIWYLHSIESKTMLAQFIIEPREDVVGVSNENGGMPSLPFNTFSQQQNLLREIRLYSKSDLIKYGTDAIPIKTVHFEYDYSLCPGIPNNTKASINNANYSTYSYYSPLPEVNQGGKLALKKVYFTYGNNTSGRLNSYQFNYNVNNPPYGLKDYDRFGNYKKNSEAGIVASNADFPYAIQDKTLADKYAQSWSLQQILLPSGGKIDIQLESDDYAYVQNKRAGQMFFVNGFGSNSTNIQNSLYSSSDQYKYIFIEVPDNSGNIYQKYIEGLDYLYFRCSIDISNKGNKDFVSGYAEFDKSGSWCGPITVGGKQLIWIKLAGVNNNNPIATQAWQFLRLNVPEDAYGFPGSQDPENNIISALRGLVYNIGEIYKIFNGFDDRAKSNSFGKEFDKNKSWVRLNNANYHKYGGGSRVKTISISDEWTTMVAGDSTKSYGQNYFYSDTTGGKNISTGVAAWEPGIGQDENPFRNPVKYDLKRKLGPDDHLYTEKPYGDALYPAPSIGYAKVTVANLHNDQIIRTATGYTINEFYTAKDFPTINSYTSIGPPHKNLTPLKFAFLGSSYSNDQHTVDQGIAVEVNDMHGKEKSVKVYNANNGEISSVNYYYRKGAPINGSDRLSNSVMVVAKDGSISTRRVGEDIDLWLDMRQQSTDVIGAGVTVNVEGFILPIGFFLVPITITPIIPKISVDHTRFRSAVAMKFVQRFGLLDSIVAIKDGSKVSTKNLLYDGETGQVLLTETTNEFNDPIYNFSYPAHWAYNQMGPAYKNIGQVFSGVSISNGKITGANTDPFLVAGDELLVFKGGTLQDKKWYVIQYGPNQLRVIDTWGRPANFLTTATASISIKIIKSGRLNMSQASIGALAMIQNSPISNSTLDLTPAHLKITQASATEFSDQWKINCSEILKNVCTTSNPKFCLDKFLNLVLYKSGLDHKNLFLAKASDNLTVRDFLKLCNCKCQDTIINGDSTQYMPFYLLTPVNSLHTGTYFEWRFGSNCTLSMKATSSNKICLDSLQTIYPENASDSCTYMFANSSHSDSVLVCTSCLNCHDECKPLIAQSDTINPYFLGMFNNWHPKKSWAYYDQRTPGFFQTQRIKNDGLFNKYTSFWTFSGGTWNQTGPANDSNWVATNTITNINRSGTEIENKDALDRYSSALYGYSETLPKAIASNAKYKEIANDNFEDYFFKTECLNPCRTDHFNFKNVLNSPNIAIVDTQSHTGRQSLLLSAHQTVVTTRSIIYSPDQPLADTSNGTYLMRNGCLDKFSPDSGQYILSAWVKENGLCNSLTYLEDSIKISFSGSAITYTFFPAGHIIEGWQRYEAIFDVPPEATAINVGLFSGANTTYFDDLRIHPFNANMKSYVYDPVSLRLMAEMDANNYATLYEYDDQGNLTRVKKETERGIVTLKESRSVYTKK